jgi:hypothetical protein
MTGFVLSTSCSLLLPTCTFTRPQRTKSLSVSRFFCLSPRVSLTSSPFPPSNTPSCIIFSNRHSMRQRCCVALQVPASLKFHIAAHAPSISHAPCSRNLWAHSVCVTAGSSLDRCHPAFSLFFLLILFCSTAAQLGVSCTLLSLRVS